MCLNTFGRTCLIGLIGLSLPACASVSGDFERASRINSIRAYEEFLSKHPDSEFEEAARARVGELEEERRREQARRARLEREAWEQAEAGNVISGYEQFLSSPEYASDAERAIRAIIRETALANAGGDRQNIASATEFPIELFSADDIMKGFGRFYVGFQVTHRTSQGSEQSMGARNFESHAEWLRYYRAIARDASTAEASRLLFDVRMVPVTSTAVSSLQSETTAAFYRDPEYATATVLRLIVDRRLASGDVEDETMSISGAGLIVLRSGNAVRVYESTARGVSIISDTAGVGNA